MRILQLIPQTVLGGAESFAYTLSCELARRGHEVLLLSNRKNGPLFSRPRPKGLEVRELDRTSRTDARILSFLIGSIRSFRPDVIHSHNFEANTWARLMGLIFPRLPVICHEHSGDKGDQPGHRFYMDRLLFPRCSAVFACSESVRSVLETRHRVPRSRLALLRNGIDAAHFSPPSVLRRDPLEVVSVANLTPVKNHALLLEAWRLVNESYPEARLTLVGDGKLRAVLEEQARSAGLAERVRFAGIHSDVRPFLWNASVFVMSSLWEAMPLAIVEAMCAGLACVAPAVGGIPEIVSDGVTGRLYPAGDAESLAATLDALLEAPETAARLGACAREYATRTYGISACAQVVEECYERAIRRGAHRPD